MNNDQFQLKEQIDCVRREIQMRQKVYTRRVDSGTMSEREADREILTMTAVLNTLLSLCPETGAPHRVEIVGTTASCADCMTIIPKREGDTLKPWKCRHCNLTIGELLSVTSEQ